MAWIFLLPGILSCACAPRAAPDPAGSRCRGPALVPVEQVWTRGACQGPDSPCATVRVRSFQAPNAQRNEAASRLVTALDRELLRRTWIGRQEAADLEDLAGNFLDSWLETYEMFPESASSREWILEKELSVIHKGSAHVSVRLKEWAYTGGAHPNHAASLLTFTWPEGRRLRLEELIAADRMEALHSLGEECLRRQRGIPGETPLEEAGFFPAEAFRLNRNFAVVSEGLLFHFDPYEIAPYSTGSVEVLLPRERLGGIASSAAWEEECGRRVRTGDR